jgi:hypothetical protein
MVDGVRHRRRRDHRHGGTERGDDVIGRRADRHHAADPPRFGRHRAQVEALVQSAGDQDHPVERPDRRRGGVRGRGLRVVVPANAARLADELDAVRRPGEGRQPGGDRSRRHQPGFEDEGGRGEPVGHIVRE